MNVSNYIRKIEEIAKSLGPAVSSMLEVSATKQTKSQKVKIHQVRTKLPT